MNKWYFVTGFILAVLATRAQTYNEVAPLFYKNCTGCHNNYGAFPLLTYTETATRSGEIGKVLRHGEMPLPWPPDTNYTRFLHERSISPSEKATILNWIAKGCKAGDTTLASVPATYSRYKLSGTPDLVLKIPAFKSNAVSDDAYDCFSLPTGLTQDRYIMAYEIVVGNPSIVHHVLAIIDTTGTAQNNLSGICYGSSVDARFGQYAPGSEPTVFPNTAPLKLGIKLKAGSNIILQIHYPLGSAGQTDSTQIRLYLYPKGTAGIREVHVDPYLRKQAMSIMPDSVKTIIQSYPTSGTIASPMSVFAIFPHSHRVDTSITVFACSLHDTIPLIRINNWNFNRQGYYVYHHMVKIPAGYVLKAIHVFNNTTRNPDNPYNPPRLIQGGQATDDEMIADNIEWINYQPGDENINIDSLLNYNQLLNSIQQRNAANDGVSTCPNPIHDTLTITAAKGPLGLVTIYNQQGQVIYRKKLSTKTESINLSAYSSGIYFIQTQKEYLRIIKQ